MSASQVRVPAWKRLGLRLKYAKETADDPVTSPSNEITAAAATLAGDTEILNQSSESLRPPKKRKLSPPKDLLTDQDGEAARVNNAGASLQSPRSATAIDSQTVFLSTETGKAADRAESSQITNQQTAPRRKSVAFTSDTKADDGFSARTLFKQSTSVGQAPSSGDTTADSISSPASKKAKRKLRSQSQKATAERSSSGLPEYVQYLELHSNDKAGWKFNKKKQTDLLKNIFNLHHLPAHLDQAILQYVEGLQGAAARRRLAESAEAVLKGIAEKEKVGTAVEDMESAEARRNAYASALKSQLERSEKAEAGRSEYDEQQLEELRQDVELGRRAEKLYDLLQQELHPEQHAAAARASSHQTESISTPARSTNATSRSSMVKDSPASSTTKSKRKTRKSRTQGSTSADSSSESEVEKRAAKGQKIMPEGFRPSSIPELSGKEYLPLEQIATGKRVIFDSDMLDSMFPKKSYENPGLERKDTITSRRGTNGAKPDESETSSEDDSDSDDE